VPLENALSYHGTVMAVDETTSLSALADALGSLPVEGLEDLYLERLHEVRWRREERGGLRREALRREGAAARLDGLLRSTDGTDRLAVAAVLDVRARSLPRLVLPPFAPSPDGESWLARQPDGVSGAAWRWSWAAVLRRGSLALVSRPALAEVVLSDGRRSLSTWPAPSVPAADPLPVDTARVAPGRTSLLLAPAAAATFVHEIVGHGLEADVRMAGAAPIGKRLFSLPLTVDDDPTSMHLPGAFSTDDEGTVTRSRRLVTDGVVTDVLADRDGAERLGVAAGNARRGSVHSRPRPRISNLLTSGPLASLDDLRHAASIEVLAVSAATFESSSATVWMTVTRACLLRRGLPRAVLAPFSARGSVETMRRGLAALGGEAESSAEPGWCRKHGETVATGAITPWLLIEGIDVG
jgi:hypothetical protein